MSRNGLGVLVAALSVMGGVVPLQASDAKQEVFDHRPAAYQDPVETYLAMKNQELSENFAALKAAGLERDIDAIYNAIVREDRFSTYNVVGETPQQKSDVVQMLALTAAHYLASVGMTPQKMEALSNVGIDVAASAVRVTAGRASFDDLMAVSETAVLGIVTGVEKGNSNETVRVQVVDASQKSAPRFLSVSSMRANFEEGVECVFFLSSSLGQFRNALGNATSPGAVAQQFEPFCKSEGGYAATSAYIGATIEVSEVHASMGAKKIASAN
ncbi:hypothetical protein MNO14_06720 [Luteimonas sp. S4-F44]|uniref:hypothetical protein n=1 Tax=Luteimonas sp. S4-F44 TaxID=2925842 RepID=UPI001F535291|nr:hypothetical protein [Luteimonas sp. S4-F44]UNK43747.1 hypothetical protein MNO14_06720 [Luteimonas sp. S4-F44]